MSKSTRYNEASINPDSAGYITVKRYPESYAFTICDNGGDIAYVEISADQVKRLIENLQIALRENGILR